MQLVTGSHRIVALDDSDPARGRLQWAPAKSLWIGSMTLGTLILGPLFFSWSGLALFIVTCGMTLCLGHSVGMHRRLIHSSFDCPLWLEYLCVYLGVSVGMAGPIGMIRTHDMRDWAQRQPDCHAFFAHRAGFWRDGWRQLHCEIVLDRPPVFQLEPRLAKDRVYAWMERTWMLQQLPWAAKIGLHPGEVDLGWLAIRAFERLGLAWAIVTPEHLPHRAELRRLRRPKPPGCPIARGIGQSLDIARRWRRPSTEGALRSGETAAGLV